MLAPESLHEFEPLIAPAPMPKLLVHLLALCTVLLLGAAAGVPEPMHKADHDGPTSLRGIAHPTSTMAMLCTSCARNVPLRVASPSSPATKRTRLMIAGP